MERYESLHHTKWECKYHLVWIPKCGRKFYMDNFEGIWDQSFGSWHCRKRVKW